MTATTSDTHTESQEGGADSTSTTHDSEKQLSPSHLNLKVCKVKSKYMRTCVVSVVKVKSQDGNEVYFKVKHTTPFLKIMTAYCKKVGVEADTVRFLFDGTRIRPDQTPEEVVKLFVFCYMCVCV